MEILALGLAYLFGSIPIGMLLSRAYSIDIRSVGSGNIGATNVQRALGWWAGIAVLIFDALKGGLVVLFARAVLNLPEPWVVACGVSAVLGHNFSLFLGFKGGKGVATSLGTMLFISPLVGGLGLGVALFNMALSRMVSAGSMTGAVAATLMALLGGFPAQVWVSCVLLTALMIYTHRENLGRLVSGTERRLGEKKA